LQLWQGYCSLNKHRNYSSTIFGALKKRRITMLKKLAVAIVLTGLMSGAAFAGQQAKTGINGSQHDMNKIVPANADALQRTCVFCHTPHSADATNTGPLWNRGLVATNVDAYTWVSPNNQAAFGYITNPLIGPSQLCLSCHDGSIAVDSHATNKAQTGSVKLTGAKQIVDLGVTHPIGMKYDATLRAGELVAGTEGFITADSSVMTASGFDTIARTGVTKGSTTIDSVMYVNGTDKIMTCASCHDVHNTVNAKTDTGADYNYFLRVREEGSAICLSCHIK
jgi:cytochrome c2